MKNNQFQQIIDALPQKPPMRMVDRLHSDRPALLIAESCPFVLNGSLTQGGIVEHVAQAYLANVMSEESSGIALLAQVNECVVHHLPKVGEVISTETELVKSAFNMFQIKGKVYLNSQLISEVKLTLSIG